ncbi:MAG: ABC transporter substrate-binding protein [Firmicutes bacterium]|nr:ABC transporter substrate-binding protein [Bacillota bacterium]
MFFLNKLKISIRVSTILLILASFTGLLFYGCSKINSVQTKPEKENTINIAVEYTDHAASFYYAQDKDLFQKSGIDINDVKVYASGVGVAAAFTKGDFDVSYMCLVPAIFTYANGGVPIKIIAGTHKNGYALVVNSSKIKKISDLENSGIKIANGPQGTTTDFLQMLLIEKENLNTDKIMSNTVRMNAAKQLMALLNGKVDAVFVPEHFATLAASFPGMKMLVKSSDIWPDMQGSVLVVTDALINNNPKIVEELKQINSKSIQLMNSNPQDAANIISQVLNINQEIIKEETKSPEANLELTPTLAAASIKNLNMTPEISIKEVQTIIDKMYELGYLTKSFNAKEIMAIN